MRIAPTVREVQRVIDAAREAKKKEVGIGQNAEVEEHQKFFAASYIPLPANDEADVTTRYVYNTVTLFSQSEGYEVFAAVNTHGGETYEVKGWTVTTLTKGIDFTSNLMSVIVFGSEPCLIAKIGGGKLPPEDECLTRLLTGLQKNELQKVQEKEVRQKLHQLAVAVDGINRKLKQREIRLQQDKQNLAKFHQIGCFEDALRNELQLQEPLLFRIQHECENLDQVQQLEQDILDAGKSEEASLGAMRKEAVLLREQEQERQIARLNAKKEIQHEQKLQQEREQKLQQDRISQQQQAARILEANKAAQKKQAAQLAAEVKNRQQAIDKCAARYERSLDAIEYKRAKLQLESIRHYIKEDAEISILRERIAHLHSRCEKSYSATLPGTASQPTQDYAGAKTGAVIGGLLGLAGGPLVAIAFAGLGSIFGDLVAPDTKSSQSSSKQTLEQQNWALLIKEINEIVQTLSEKKEQ